jgi:hypothetical protein
MLGNFDVNNYLPLNCLFLATSQKKAKINFGGHSDGRKLAFGGLERDRQIK